MNHSADGQNRRFKTIADEVTSKRQQRNFFRKRAKQMIKAIKRGDHETLNQDSHSSTDIKGAMSVQNEDDDFDTGGVDQTTFEGMQ